MNGTEVTGGIFADWNIQRLSANNAKWLQRPVFENCCFHTIDSASNLAGIDFKVCTFTKTSFKGVDLSGTTFLAGTRFENVDFTGALIAHDTDFSAAQMSECRIDRQTYDLIEPGRISNAQTQSLQVDDPVATMRLAFSGIMQYIHLGALLIFLGPYLWFLVVNGLLNRPPPVDAPQMTLLEKFWLYLITAGDYDELDAIHLLLVAFLLLYNVNRFILLWKTKRLEMEKKSKLRLAPFAFRGKWKLSYQFSNYGFWFNLVCALIHTVHFFLVKVAAPNSQ